MIVLSAAELAELTKKVRSSAQARELDAMGIPYRRRRRGSLAVLRIHAERLVPGPPKPATLPTEPELDLDGL